MRFRIARRRERPGVRGKHAETRSVRDRVRPIHALLYSPATGPSRPTLLYSVPSRFAPVFLNAYTPMGNPLQ